MSQKPSPRLQLRIFLGRSVAIGPGKADLLAAVAETGSISAAGRSMGMSYKKAWYLLDTMNRCFKTPLVEASKGGRGFGGARVTPLGEEVLERYRSIQARAAVAFADDLDALNALVSDEPPEAD
ncbi:MAG: LysR family transcriptional regulator [Methylobacterium sp. SCN 67-24]|jgi:molybdate transport system regulatory protein|nr:winged helix-turn-helix domain-containing protein [Bosea sp. (in: a-proteobacteria)]ODT49076.1 MAG: LysR family transcriptional regulator [Methylobacterium sp. SCN 67-24]